MYSRHRHVYLLCALFNLFNDDLMSTEYFLLEINNKLI
jgi:hypothetical protein